MKRCVLIAFAALATTILAADKPAIEQGITLTFSQNGKTDARAARLISLYVPEMTAPTPFLAPGPFTATFSGFVNRKLRTEVTFSLHGRGKASLKINNAVVLEADGEFNGKASNTVKLEKGKNAFEVVFTPPASGDAAIRLMWASREWPEEPVQPAELSHDVSAPALAGAMNVRAGRELFAGGRCINCHEVAIPRNNAAMQWMPELHADSPDLAAAGARLKTDWLAAWINDPKALRPDASMPKIVREPRQAADLATYLATLGKADAADEKEPEDEAVAQGAQLFGGLGCIGCHTKPDAEIDKEGGRTALKFVKAKFRPGALRAWLVDPQQHYNWTKMPNFRLSDLEADRLVAYLMRNANGEIASNELKGDAAKGKALFGSLGCVNCHKLAVVTPTVSIKTELAKLDWSKGCSAGEAQAGAPHFALDDVQRGALKAFAATGTRSLAHDVVTEFAQRAVKQLRCTACHSRDEVEDGWTTHIDEIADMLPPEQNIEGDQNNAQEAGPKLFHPRGLGELAGGDQIVISGDQSRPSLTWTGEKLRAEMSAKMIAGEAAYKPRYWLRARMPGFPVHAKALAAGLAMEHGVSPTPAANRAPKPELAEIGLKLVSRDGGFSCITCHSVGDMKATSAFEAPAPNFIHVTERMNADFYKRWMRKPMRFYPGTKMPEYSEGGKSTLKDVYDGDADKQFQAVWEYLLQGPKMTPPE